MPTTTLIPSTNAPEKIFRIIGYIVGGAAIPDLIQYDKLTHINYAFLIPNSDGSMKTMANGWKLEKVVELAHAHGVKVLISVGGWGWDDEFEQLAADSASRVRFVDEMDQFAQTYHLDGVDIDWEYPGPGEASAQNFVVLMQALEAQLHPQGKLLTAAVVAAGQTGDDVLPAVFEMVDFVNLMAYDGPGANHSSYEYALQAVDYWSSRGLPAEKMVLGVPFYARPTETIYRKLVEANPQAALMDSIEYSGATVYYNGIPTMRLKTELAIQRASGIMIWELAQDSNDDTSLLTAIFQTVYGNDH